ncbi:MAG TPA: bifunctional phosphoribosylaminoimidazolecarboxamide formyltransferase/IMP cyclohydrolase [Kiloniellales bacterium]|nr:bifunctional phosphoribosylaminoimidazolecarboxamide formyltransferase/IMP cyclohydrolase [Kiloniellales bacterium]
MAERLPIRRALLSVSDKTGLVELARALADGGAKLVSTGGTARALAEAGLTVTEVASVTGFPEILDGRVKTLHPAIHAGLLARRDLPAHEVALAEHDLERFDLLVVNLYPFEATLAAGAEFAACIENIDVGGPAMLRAAAKNHEAIAVVTDPADYAPLLAEVEAGGVTPETRRRLAAKAFALTAGYDAAISGWLQREAGLEPPPRFALAGRLAAPLRYGENPHQKAALYLTAERRSGAANARQLQGKELSYNNLADADAAFECVAEFERPAVVIVKHANPCGVAEGVETVAAYKAALACDPTSAFGGIVALNRPLDAPTAAEIAKLFTEVIIAPGASPEAAAIIATKKNLRLLVTDGLPDPAAPGSTVKCVAGGFLLQDRDTGRVDPAALKVATRRAPTAAELADLVFAFRVAKHVRSNAIVYARGLATVGIGAGQMSRVDAARIAAWKAGEAFAEGAKGSVVASDAFFPFADGLEAAVGAGATAVIQPGGSLRDAEVIAAADKAGLAMVFTGLRHFRH